MTSPFQTLCGQDRVQSVSCELPRIILVRLNGLMHRLVPVWYNGYGIRGGNPHMRSERNRPAATGARVKRHRGTEHVTGASARDGGARGVGQGWWSLTGAPGRRPSRRGLGPERRRSPLRHSGAAPVHSCGEAAPAGPRDRPTRASVRAAPRSPASPPSSPLLSTSGISCGGRPKGSCHHGRRSGHGSDSSFGSARG